MTPPKVVTPVVLNMARGQSLSAGPTPSGTAPNGQTWQQVFYGNDQIHSVAGLRYANGNLIPQIVAPMGQGYGAMVGEPSSKPMPVMTFVSEGAVVSHGLVREGLVPGVISHQWHDIGGISVSTIRDPDQMPYRNAEFWLTQAMVAYDQAESVTVPRIIWNQGEADLAWDRGQWALEFAACWTGMVEQIQRITGQVEVPRLYMHQTGGYGNKSVLYWTVLDQLDAIVAHNGILIGPNWAHLVDNYDDRMVHMGMVGNIGMSEMTVWAIAETEAGRQWNLLPGAASRVGNTITIPISVRNDETLTTAPGKYSGYGGDPADLGLEVVGGGSIVSASVSGGDIVLEVSGAVTAVRHAFQQTGVDYRNHLDGDGCGYVTHRSLIRTTLTKSVTYGGLTIQLERWVPSFEVTVS